MNIKAQVGMVMNLDKCIGCHTCSVTCKNTWTNRSGAEYMYWNNVETKPGIGYPKQWEDQERYNGGWELKNGKLELKSGTRAARLLNIFHNPDQPTLDDYFEPWTYDYEKLTASPEQKHQPVARAKSKVTGKYMDLTWGPNWEDDLAGVNETGREDPNLRGIEESILMEFEQVFMMYLPRICEHCINPACVSSCPSGAMYKREEDGIVLVDQNACRAWRFCVSSCPYKKVYFNWQTNKAEKCTLCFPRIEAGMPTICSETCVGRIRYLGLMFYDADKVKEAASVADEKNLYKSQLGIFLDPHDPDVIREARRAGIPEDWILAAQRSPIYKMVMDWGIALPLHPEYRTLPMVWYVPPLSPIMNRIEGIGSERDPYDIFPAIDGMRIPLEYLANLLTAGDVEVIRNVLRKMAVMRMYMRNQQTQRATDPALLSEIGMDEQTVEDMYRLLAIAKYDDRFVIPPAHREQVADLFHEQGGCGLSFAGGPGSCGVF
ncbi:MULTISPECIES: nitrate reductase subunit beta [Brevibacillus]|uniref:Nitrate reductase subunit beta n=1 Tax=Brevibacillus aydinogluensis TaxID=927786 RepID=A0AA48M9V9_9BACL|nr:MULTISPECIES: nitrate reductase subunit beta [Brevibacillus]MBR8661063.1 nitrate reductase subunit beta [Brevibacillus sp. NL20B1]MDT3417527.1 nitrate reductase beta subunit [Brevibacillus aydinogluensis]NNV03610.1 nitrate reductase subunit beta [Brevibacillus sp. MCWH]CAJ1003949.1 nitrate reductase subunit beta [Brevibacillus aydinogluensis]